MLREPYRRVTTFGERLARLVTDLMDTVRQPGRAGLAAPQIGVDLRVSSYDVDGQPVRVTGRGGLARCLPHERGHLDGHLFLDRLGPAERREALRFITRQPGPAAIPGRGGPGALR